MPMCDVPGHIFLDTSSRTALPLPPVADGGLVAVPNIAPESVGLLFRVHLHHPTGRMSELHASLATVLESPATDSASASAARAATTPLEFVGASDDTIAEAVRRALSHASSSLRPLDGVGVVVIPEIDRAGASPRFQVRLRISPAAV